MRQISMVAEITDIKGIGPAKAETLNENGYESVDDIADADPEELAEVDGVGEDRALEFIVGAEDVLAESSGDEFDLTPAEVGDELEDESEDDEEPLSEFDDEEDAEDSEDEESSQEGADSSENEDEEDVYDVNLSFNTRMEYDTFHAALMDHHERVYTSHQPASDVMENCLEQLYGNEASVSMELSEFELNTLHTAVKQKRTNYQGDNLIDHMDALKVVEQEIDKARREHLF